MGTAFDRRTVGFGAVMKRLHYAWIIVSVTFLILLAVGGAPVVWCICGAVGTAVFNG